MPPSSLADIQKTQQDRWLGFDRILREECGIYGGLPSAIDQYPIETRSEHLRKFIEIYLDVAEQKGHKTWRGEKEENREEGQEWQFVNSWRTKRPIRGYREHATVSIWKHKATGKVEVSLELYEPEIVRLQFILDTHIVRKDSTFASAELKAQDKLYSMLHSGQQLSYLMSDGFFEASERSGVRYFLRKNRPTLAFGRNDELLCALCLHPLAYYSGTWAGVMVPSDEVMVHLNYIRADEHLYWRKANQLPADLANSGV